VDLDCPQGRRLDATYSDDVSFNRAKALRTYQIEGFDRGNAYPARTLACPFSASWTGQGEAPTSGVCAFTTAADDGVWPFVGGRRWPGSREVPVTDICGLFDTKRGTLIWWRIDQHCLQVIELSMGH
jgi:hypothetical protein